MVLNNPFIRYKIYSTPSSSGPENLQPGPEIRILCLISEEENEVEPFLRKVLEAARLDPSTYALCSLAPEDGFLISQQKWFGQLDYILAFGVPVSRIGLQIPEQWYHPRVLEKTGILQFPPLTKIQSDKMEKQKLWQTLKKEFLHD